MTFTANKAKLTISIEESTDEKLRSLAFKHRKTTNLSALTEAMILHCLGNRHFLTKLEEKLTKKEEDCEI